MAINIKEKIEELLCKIENDQGFSGEFAAAPAKTVKDFFSGEADGISENDAELISKCIESDMKEENAKIIGNGYYYNSSQTSFIHIESSKVTFYHVTYSSYTDMCGVAEDQIYITERNFAVTLDRGQWYYFRNGTIIYGDSSLPVQGTCSGSTITISGTGYTK